MKTVWTIASTLAVANLLALLGLVGWLAVSDRLDLGRLHQARQLFSVTLTQEAARQEEERKQAEAARLRAEERAKEGTAPLGAADRLRMSRQESAIELQRRLRLQREMDDLRRALQAERDKLERDKADFLAQKDAWERERADILATARDEQFQKTLGTYEQLKPDKAKIALQELLKDNQVERVVAYLDGMQDRTRTRVIDEFIKDDPKLAADLLERLRARGVEPRVAAGPAR
jgi:hypothetical protein